MDDFPSKIEDPAELSAVRTQAARIHRTAILVAALGTLLSLLI